MWLIVAALAAGVAAGAARLLPGAWIAGLGRVMAVTLFVMLAALGAQIGANRELLANLATLGWRAAVISAFSIAGSVAVLYIAVRRLGLVRERGGDA